MIGSMHRYIDLVRRHSDIMLEFGRGSAVLPGTEKAHGAASLWVRAICHGYGAITENIHARGSISRAPERRRCCAGFCGLACCSTVMTIRSAPTTIPSKPERH